MLVDWLELERYLDDFLEGLEVGHGGSVEDVLEQLLLLDQPVGRSGLDVLIHADAEDLLRLGGEEDRDAALGKRIRQLCGTENVVRCTPETAFNEFG